MRSIARRTAVGAALLLVMPVAVWISGWRWQPGEQSWLLKAAFWVTETVTQPWGVITHLILFGWFLWCLRFRIKAAFVLFAILAAAILVGAGGGGNVACATNLWAINTTCGRKSRNSATRTRKLTLVDFPNLALKSSTMRVDAISQTARKWYFKGLLR